MRRVALLAVLLLLFPAAPAAAQLVVGDGPSGPVLAPGLRAEQPGPVVVIDPGHSGKATSTRTVGGLRDVDYPNYPELYEVWDVSVCAAASLRADGYRVVLTKHHATDSVSLTERARIADRHHAALAVSVHDDHSQGPSFQAVYSQQGTDGQTMYRGTGTHRVTFDQPAVAAKSAAYAAVMAKARATAQGRTVRIAQNSFDGRPGLEPGNLALVQLLSTTPWVYHEAGVEGTMSVAAETAYAAGLVAGIERSVPVAGADGPDRGTLGSCLQRAQTDRPERYRSS